MRNQAEPNPDPDEDDEFAKLIDSVIRVVDANSGRKNSPDRVKEHVVVLNRSMAGESTQRTKRALAFAVKNDRLKRDEKSYWIPGRPEDEDEDEYPDFERPKYPGEL